MANDPLQRLHQREREQERHRLRELEAKDREVETARGPRPLEGYAGGHTTWTGRQTDDAAEDGGADVRDAQSERPEHVRMDSPEPDAEGP